VIQPDFAARPYYELKPVGNDRERMYEYPDSYLYEDRKRKQFYKYRKTGGQGANLLWQVMDNCGNTMTFQYRTDGRLEAAVDPFGRVIRFQQEHPSCCTGMLLPDGRETAITYDPQGRMANIVNFAGVPTSFTYDVSGRMDTIVVGKKQKTTKFAYTRKNGRDFISMVTDRNGSVTKYEMASTNPEVVVVSGPDGTMRRYESRQGNTERMVDPDGSKLERVFQDGRPVAVTDKNGNRQTLGYDIRGNLILRTDAFGHVEMFVYDARDNLVEHTDMLGRTTKLSYDARNNLAGMMRPDGSTALQQYDGFGRLVQVTQPNGNNLNFEYDAFANITMIRDNYGCLYKAQYDNTGYNLLEWLDAHGIRTQVRVDALGRQVETAYPDGTTESSGYDCCAGVLSIDRAGNSWMVERDSMSRITKRIAPSGDMKGYRYDAAGRLVQRIDELGNPLTFEYGRDGLLAKMTNALGGTIEITRDPNGNPLAILDERHHGCRFEYDRNNQLQRITDPAGSVTEYGYDAAGHPSFYLTPRGHRIDYAYGANSQIVQKRVDNQPVADIAYDVSGEFARITDPSGQIDFEQDGRSRTTSLLFGGRERFTFEYDSGDHLVGLVYPDGLVVRYEYDAMGRQAAAEWNGHFIRISYDACGRMIAIIRSNETESRYSYDNTHHVTGIMHIKKDIRIACMQYQYDAAGNLMMETLDIPLLESVADEACKEDVRLTCNNLNQVERCNGDLHSYDPDGNLVGISGADQASFRYDAENRIIGKTTLHGETAYACNALNQLVGITRNGKTLRRHFDPMNRLLAEVDDEQGMEHHIYLEEQLAATLHADGRVSFYHHDHRGNTAAVSDKVGEVVCAYAYMPYGSIRRKIEKMENQRFTFMGAFGVRDEQDGFFLTANRCYDARLGRFLQNDPLGFTDGQNLYAYAGGNPMTKVDPDGTLAFLPILVGFITGSYIVYKAPPIIKGVWNTNAALNQANLKVYRLKKDYYNAREKGNWGLATDIAQEIGDARRDAAKAQAAFENEMLNLGWNIGAIGASIYNGVIPALGIAWEAGKGIYHTAICSPPPPFLGSSQMQNQQMEMKKYKMDPSSWTQS